MKKKEAIRKDLLNHVANLTRYWEKESRQPNVRDKLEGLAFSILSALDGCAMGVPGFHLIPMSEYEDEHSDEIHDKDIGGSLHGEIYKCLKKVK